MLLHQVHRIVVFKDLVELDDHRVPELSKRDDLVFDYLRWQVVGLGELSLVDGFDCEFGRDPLIGFNCGIHL